ncbi:MAG: hydroxymethylbilane synthase [bacterium]
MAEKGKFRVGTRGSALAMRQTRMIIDLLAGLHPDARFEIVEIVTHGDRFQTTPIAEMGEHIDRGIFNTGLEEAVLGGEVDLATCSFKDVESELPAGLIAVTAGKREDPRDVLVSRHRLPLADLPAGATLATSSPRRISQLAAFRQDFRFHPLRGNLTTRVGEAAEKFDGVIVAAAGMVRMGLQEKITEWIEPDRLLPAAAQAAMGCQYAAPREDVAALVESLRDPATELCAQLEKRVLVTLSGGCFAPIGVLARLEGGALTIRCRIVSLDGKRVVEERVAGGPEQGEQLVRQIAGRLTARGGRALIAQTRAALSAG